MDFVYKNELSTDDYNELRESVGWKRINEEQASLGLQNSEAVFGCYRGNSIAGGARITWDKGYIAYLADVVVKPEFQGNGIGKELVEQAIYYMKSHTKPGWRVKLVLIAAKGKEGFYEKLGFVRRPNDNSGSGMDLCVVES